MNDIVTKLILAFASLALTAVVITTYITFYQRTKELSSTIQQKEELQQAQIEDYTISRYNNCYIYGSQVISFLKNNKTFFESVTLNENDILLLDDYNDLNSDAYICTNKVYLLQMEKNTNGVYTKLSIILSDTP